MERVDLVVVGTICLPDATIPDGFVAVRGGSIAAVGRRGNAPEAAETIEIPGTLVMPGVIDGHVHSLGSPTEGFRNSTSAAVAGGVTTIVDMASDLQWPETTLDIRTTPEAIERKIDMGHSEALCDFALWGGVTPETLPHLDRMATTGVVGFKLFMADSRRSGRMDDGSLLEAFAKISEMDLIAAVHAENAEITRFLIAKYKAEGKVEPKYHTASRPEVVEIEAFSRALTFAEETGVHLHFVHTSLPRSVRMARSRGLEGVRVTLETCPHYLLLTDATLESVGGAAKMMPALRPADRAEELWELVRDGWVDVIGTDHSGHAAHTKLDPDVFEQHAGMPGVQTLLPLMYSEGVVKRGLTLEWLVTMLCGNPARLYRLNPRKGTLQPGADADIVIFDPAAKWTVRASDLRQAAGYTAFEGWDVTGRPVMTIARGEIVYRDGNVLARPGRGQFIPVGPMRERKGAFTVSGRNRPAEVSHPSRAGLRSDVAIPAGRSS